MIYTSSKSTLGAHWRVTALVIHVKDSKEKVGFNLESARTFFIELLVIDGRRPRENTFVCKSSKRLQWPTQRRVGWWESVVNSPESQRSQDTPALRRCHRRSRINASFSPNALIFCWLACTFDISAAVFSLTCLCVSSRSVASEHGTQGS